MSNQHRAAIALIKLIPTGKVASYGQIALCLQSLGARQIGRLLAHENDPKIPWHRVINAQGRISPRPGAGPHQQRRLLEAEGVKFSKAGRISFAKYGWHGPSLSWLRRQGWSDAQAIDILARFSPRDRQLRPS